MKDSGFSVTSPASYGHHRFEMSDGLSVSALSAPDWLTFEGMLGDSDTTSDVYVGPEAITDTRSLQAMARNPARSEPLINTASEIAGKLEKTVVFGSFVPATDDPSLIENALVVMDADNPRRMHSKAALSAYESHSGVVALDPDPIPREPIKGITPILSYELVALGGLLERGIIDPDTRALAVSACWAIPDPLQADRVQAMKEELRSPLFKDPNKFYAMMLSLNVRRAFGLLNNLADVVVVDRFDEQTSPTTVPMNVHVQRHDTA